MRLRIAPFIKILLLQHPQGYLNLDVERGTAIHGQGIAEAGSFPGILSWAFGDVGNNSDDISDKTFQLSTGLMF